MRMLFKGEHIEGEHYMPGSIVRKNGRFQVRTYDGKWTDVAAPPDYSVRGDKGDPGRDGRHGIDGKNGRDGERGNDGRDGVDGKRGPRGRKGEDGHSYSYTRIRRETSPDGVPVTAMFDAVTGQGMAVYVSGDNRVALAKADAFATSVPVGLSKATVSPGPGEYVTGGPLTLDDWTGATGGPNLTPNAIYYVSPDVAGMLTTTCPESSGQYVLIVGTALSQRTLLVELHRSYRNG